MLKFRTVGTASPSELSALDATFLELEDADDGANMHIGGALLFEPTPRAHAPSIEAVRALVADRLDILPRYRQRLSEQHVGGLARPVWEHDTRFNVAAHVRHATLPAPGGDRELLDWISDFYSHRLDRTRPLWELVLLDGLADGRWGLVWKTHHCLVDGVGSVDIAHLLLEVSSKPPKRDQTPGHRNDRAPRLHSWPSQPIRQATSAALTAGGAVAHSLGHPRDALESWRAAVELLVRNEMVAAPHSSINQPIGSTRNIAAVRFPLEEIKSISAALGGTVNDVLLCAATTGLRSLLLARDERLPVRGLRAMVPVNRRRDDELQDLGNRIAALSVSLPVAESGALERYRRIRRATAAAKSGGGASGSSALLELAALAPPVLHSAFVRSIDPTRLFNLTITNVPGPTLPLYAFGARLVDVVPVVPLAAGQTIGIAIVSYAGGITVGICCDRASVPDLDVVADGIFGALVELDALAHSRAA